VNAVPTDKGEPVEQPIISGVAHDRSEAKVTVVGVPDKPGEAALIFEALATAEVNVDMIVQNVSAAATGLTDISFTMPHADTGRAVEALGAVRDAAGFTELIVDDEVGKVSLIGAGMRTNAGVSATFFRALSDAGVNVEMISTSEIRISVITRANDLEAAVAAIHTAFGLDVADGEAVVYGGTGR
jgi:aspartate kinase